MNVSRLGDEKAYLSNWTDSKGKCLLYEVEAEGLFPIRVQRLLQTIKKGAILALKCEKILYVHAIAYNTIQNVKTSDSSSLHLTLVLRVLFILSFCLLLSWFSSICLTDKMTCSFFLFVELQALLTGFYQCCQLWKWKNYACKKFCNSRGFFWFKVKVGNTGLPSCW